MTAKTNTRAVADIRRAATMQNRNRPALHGRVLEDVAAMLVGLRVLQKQPGIRVGNFGQAVYGDRDELRTRMPQHFARAGGNLLRRLCDRGLVTAKHSAGFVGWHLTPKGHATAVGDANVPERSQNSSADEKKG